MTGEVLKVPVVGGEALEELVLIVPLDVMVAMSCA
jgi:hypothetical protein